MRIQKEFKVTPEYVEIEHNDAGYHMGVYLCIGQPIWKVTPKQALPFKTIDQIHAHLQTAPTIFVFLGKGVHKIKKKSEQMACEDALKKFKL